MRYFLLLTFLLYQGLIIPSRAEENSSPTDTSSLQTPTPLELLRITPDGEDVEEERQLTFTFNQPVVPLGNMTRSPKNIPITVSPNLKCQWRWLNTTTLACQLGDEHALKLATRYQITISPHIWNAAKKLQLTKPITHHFETQRPKLAFSMFQVWHTPGTPVLQVHFNQPIFQDSVAKHLYFTQPDGNRVALQIEQLQEEGTPPPKDPTLASVWLISPQQELPLNTTVTLKVEPGLQSPYGELLGTEDREETKLDTFPEFTFLGVRCTNLKDEEITFSLQQKTSSHRCDPVQGVYLIFSSPVSLDMIKQHLRITPDLAGGRHDYDPWEGYTRHNYLDRYYDKEENYRIWLPEVLKAYQIYQLQADNLTAFQDQFGRSLTQPINFQFATDHRAPRHQFEHEFSILEQGVDSELPIYITNLTELTLNYHLLGPQNWSAAKRKTLKIPKVQDITFRMPLRIRELLPTKNGVIQGYFTTQPNLNNAEAPEQNWFWAQVTPFQIQAKVGHHNTLLWLTDLAQGQPVPNAQCTLQKNSYQTKKYTPKVLETVTTDAQGLAYLPGTQQFDPKLEVLESYDKDKPHFSIRCQKEDAVVLLPLDYNFQVNMSDIVQGDYELYPYTRSQYGHIHTWGTTAQGLYKVGDTLQYKLWVRDQGHRHFISAPRKSYTLKIIDPKDQVVHQKANLTLSEFGGLSGEFTLPKTAAVGWYQFQLSADFTEETWQPMQVLISDFTPSPFKVQTQLNGTLFHQGQTVKVETLATLHAGGPYTDAHNKVQAVLQQYPLQPAKAKGFSFDVFVEKANDETVHSTEKNNDDQGKLLTEFTLPAKSKVLYGQLIVESTVRDERGKDVANRVTANYVGRDRFVGLKETSWLLTAQQNAKILTMVVDANGQPLKDIPIQVKIAHKVTKAAQVKGAGNAYLTQYQHEWQTVAQCQITSSLEGTPCEFVPPKSGDYQVTASIQDSQGRAHSTQLYQWALGKDQVVWETTPGNALEIKPEQEQYAIGETARYLVKNPFPNSQALITVERFGMLESRVETFNHSLEIVEIPIEPDHLPGFFISVTVVSPRVEKPVGADSVDLGKPAFRMGYVKTRVKDPYKELQVSIQTDKPSYKPGEKVTLNLQVVPRPLPTIPKTDSAISKSVTVPESVPTILAELLSDDPMVALLTPPAPPVKLAKSATVLSEKSTGEQMKKSPPIELTVTVLDEAVFDLLTQGRAYFDPYAGFYTLDSLDVSNYSLLMRLVGRQKFEKKGATPGGDGGLAGLDMRSLFKYVSYWNPDLPTDKQGNARIQFTVPDNLTAWRVLALAVTPEDKLGLGDITFKVNQPVEIRAILPNQIIQGDEFQAGFSVLNRTDQERDLSVELEVKGPIAEIATEQLQRQIKVAPFKRYTLWLPLKTTGLGTIEFKATAQDAQEHDALASRLEVQPPRALETVATHGSTLKEVVTEELQFPTAMQPEVGGVTVVTSSTILSDLEGAFRYIRDYPYQCWEQKLTKGMMAAHSRTLSAYLPDSFSWEQAETLITETLAETANYQAPNGGMTFWLPQDDYVSPYLSAYTALAFNWLRADGYAPPATVETALHDYLLTLLRRNNTLPQAYSREMASSVRAVALAALAPHAKISYNDIKRYRTHLDNMDLFSKALFLEAALQVEKTADIQKDVVKRLLSRAQQTAGKVVFQETLDTEHKHLLSSPLRTQCAILSSLVGYQAKDKKGITGDLPLHLARHIAQARRGEHWGNTQENLFCLQALAKYAKVYENQAPNLSVAGWLDEEVLGNSQFKTLSEAPVLFERALTAKDPGRAATVKLTREGQGRLYYSVRLSYSPTDEQAEAVDAGFEVQREYHVKRQEKWVLLQAPWQVKTGELVRVDLYVSTPAPRYFVVVDDPVPGGIEPVNRDLATSAKLGFDAKDGDYASESILLSQAGWQDAELGNDYFYHRELRHQAARFFADYLPAGNYHLSYTAQVIAPGQFKVMPTHVEEMYEPEVYGKSVPKHLKVTR